MARIEQRGNSYRIIVELAPDPVTGERKIFRKTVKPEPGKKITKKQLNDEMVKFEAECRDGNVVNAKGITFAQTAKMWLESIRQDLKPTTYASYKMIVNRHLCEYFGNKVKIKDMARPVQVLNYKTFKLQYGNKVNEGALSNRTVEYHMRVLSMIFDFAISMNWIKQNPAKSVAAPKVSRAKRKAKYKILSPDEMRRFLDARDNEPYFDAWYFDIITGLRRGELLGLSLKAIDLQNKSAMVSQTVLVNPFGKGVLIDDTPKNEESIAPFALTNELVEIINRRKAIIEQNKKLLGNAYKDYGLLFCQDDGSPISPKTFYNHFKQYTRNLGIEMRFHDLRHNCASLLLALRYDYKVVQEVLRHSNPETSFQYMHLRKPTQGQALQEVEDEIRGLSTHFPPIE